MHIFMSCYLNVFDSSMIESIDNCHER
jgi:hypothetical protein